MKQKYFLSFSILFLFAFTTIAQSVVITTVVDGTIKDDSCAGGSGSDPRFIELYVDGTIDFTGYDLDVEINGSADTAGINWVSKNISSLGSVSDKSIYIVSSSDLNSFDAAFPNKTRIGVSLGSINGDDSFRIEDNLGNILDIFGNPNEINSSTTTHSWNYKDSYAKRKNFILPNGGTFVSTNWTYGGVDALDGATCTTLASTINLGSYAVKTTNWVGLNSNWEEAGNWDNGVPTLGYNTVIPDVAIAPEINTNIAAKTNDLTISETDGLSILSGSLTISGDLTINAGSSLYLESKITASETIDAATVILNGTYFSTDVNKFSYFTETFEDNTSGWTLISSPTIGEKIDGNTGDGNFAYFNKLQKSTVNLNYGIAFYDNSQTDSNVRWNYYSIAEIEVPTSIVNMVQGKGYTVLPESDPTKNANGEKGFLGFKGDFPTEFVEIEISDNSTSGGNNYNLVGNPYPSFIPANNAADATNAFLNINSTQLAEETFYVWEKKTTSYKIKNQMNARYFAPGQAFFVKSKTGGGTLKFTEAMQSHQASATFNKSVDNTKKIILKIDNNKFQKTTEIYYEKGKTTGFDNGYDSSIFNGFKSSFDIYTKLVSNNDDKKLGIQTLPSSNYENMVIPIGIAADKNSEITFSLQSINLPSEYMVFLEDRLNQTYTRLDQINSKYKVTIDNDSIENRFFIHTKTSSVLNLETENFNRLQIFKVDNFNIKVTGLTNQKADIVLYNILGKNIFTTSFKGNLNNKITLPNLTKGVYIVKLKTENSTKIQKIIID